MKYEIIQNIIIGLIILAIAAAFITIFALAITDLVNQPLVIDKSTTYILMGTTKMYSDVSDTLIIEDDNGKLWSFISHKFTTPIPLDTVCAMIINDNETENFDDDYIIDVIFKNG